MTHPEHDEERESLVRWIVDKAQAFAEDKPVATFPVAEVRKRIAAHTAKEVEAARRGFADQLKLAMIDGKASHSVSRINEIIDQELAAAENFDHLKSQRKGDV